MILSELMHAVVVDAEGKQAGRIIDLRFVVDGAPPAGGAGGLADARLYGLVVSPHGRPSYWGYERRDETGPAIINRLLGWLHRGTFLVEWGAVEGIDRAEPDRAGRGGPGGRLVVRLAPGFARLSPILDAR